MPIDTEKELGRLPSPESFVYLLYSDGLIKIGYSRDAKKRMAALRRMSASPMSMLCLIAAENESAGRLWASRRHVERSVG
jgi:T5orf172 domain